ncbi:MAG: FAA hydrolase family protein [Dehalococcoidia bacterium]|nr:FAA hydrolase family protein [Dehalococcoidia bacterium]
MLIARFIADGQARHGVVEQDAIWVLKGSPFDSLDRSSTAFPLSKVKLLAPCQPRKVFAVGLNYLSHLGERQEPKDPGIFLKNTSAIIGPQEPIVLPTGVPRVDMEGELVVVIGRRARNVSPQNALQYILGYTCGNDVSAREWQRNDLQWWRAKGSDTFAPLGPWIATGLDPSKLRLVSRVNGVVTQESGTDLLITDVAHIVSFISQHVTLEQEDVIYTGTPGQTPPLTPGDVAEVEISGIGVLRNPVKGA